LERIPDEDLGPGLKGGAEFFEKALHPVFFIGLDIDDGGLRQDELLQILQNLLFFGDLFHKIVQIIHKLTGNVNFNFQSERGLNVCPSSNKIEKLGGYHDRQF
jgi:hypothetical protein